MPVRRPVNLVIFPILAMVVGLASPALAAGGGASSGGSDAQNHPANGLPPGEPGPPGANNNPSRTSLPPDARNEGAVPATGSTAPAHR